MKDKKWAELNDLETREAEELFSEVLDSTHDDIIICSYTYNTSDALKKIDPIAFRQEMLNYIDSLLQDGDYTELDDGTLVETREYNKIED